MDFFKCKALKEIYTTSTLDTLRSVRFKEGDEFYGYRHGAVGEDYLTIFDTNGQNVTLESHSEVEVDANKIIKYDRDFLMALSGLMLPGTIYIGYAALVMNEVIDNCGSIKLSHITSLTSENMMRYGITRDRENQFTWKGFPLEFMKKNNGIEIAFDGNATFFTINQSYNSAVWGKEEGDSDIVELIVEWRKRKMEEMRRLDDEKDAKGE